MTRRTLAIHAGVVLLLLVLSVLVWWRIWVSGHGKTAITCGCGDPAQGLWFLEWTPHAISHGLNPFFTNSARAGQGGANMLANTGLFLPSLLLWPFTTAFGPVFSFNLAILLAPVISGWCCFLFLRKVTRFLPGQVIGAVFYGFSPYMIGNSPFGHINLTWLFFPPLAAILVTDLWRGTRSPASIGRRAALLIIVQFFIGTEVLAVSALVALPVLVYLALSNRDRARSCGGRGFTALLWTGAISVPVLAYPLWFALFGPQHIKGAPWTNVAAQGNPISSLVNPGQVHVVTPLLSYDGYSGPRGPYSTFLGWPLVLFLGLSIIVWRRRRVAWVGAIAVVWAALLSFGSWSRWDFFSNAPHGATTWWLPWRWLSHLPVIEQISPQRFSGLMTFGAAVLMTIAVEEWWRVARARQVHLPSGVRLQRVRSSPIALGAGLTCLLIALLSVIVSTYTLPFRTQATPGVPKWFTTTATRLPEGTRLLVLPYANSLPYEAMAWQALNGLHYEQAGGYLLTPGPDGRISKVPPRGTAEALLLDFSYQSGRHAPRASDKTAVRTVRKALRRWRIDRIVLTNRVPHTPRARAFLTKVVGRRPEAQDGVWTWAV